MNKIILNCYKECPRTQNLHNDFSGFTVEECVEDILKKLKDFGDYKFIKVEKEGELVGYYITTKIEDLNFLFTFFVRPEFRNSKDLTFFWNNIKEEFNGEFAAGVYTSNKPARNFLIRNNGIEFNLENASFFKFTGE